jgi:hypothetical protein
VFEGAFPGNCIGGEGGGLEKNFLDGGDILADGGVEDSLRIRGECVGKYVVEFEFDSDGDFGSFVGKDVGVFDVRIVLL